jgi:hypothetical protein
MTLTIPRAFQHSIIKTIINDCYELKVMPEILECGTNDGTVIGSLVIKFKFHGSKDDLRIIDGAIDDYIEQIRKST